MNDCEKRNCDDDSSNDRYDDDYDYERREVEEMLAKKGTRVGHHDHHGRR